MIFLFALACEAVSQARVLSMTHVMRSDEIVLETDSGLSIHSNRRADDYLLRIYGPENYTVSLTCGNQTTSSCTEGGTYELSLTGSGSLFIFHPGPTGEIIGQNGINNGSFINPGFMAFDRTGRIYVADTGNDRIQILDRRGAFIDRFGSFGVPGSTADSENEILNPGSLARFNKPSGISVATEIFVCDSGNHRIAKFDRFGNLLRTFGNFGTNRQEFDTPLDLALDSRKNLFIVDSGNHRIKKYDLNGYLLLRLGTFGQAPGQFIRPRGISIGPDDRVYVIDSGNNRIQCFDGSGGFICQGDFSETAAGPDLESIGPFVLAMSGSCIHVFDKNLVRCAAYSIPEARELHSAIMTDEFMVLSDSRTHNLIFRQIEFYSINLTAGDSVTP
ncbi:MAG: NHL repeat-containing protein [Candidatus Wallbacteria bacterium]|nr:NHL repeat-containing protein [Candidatus Wallbacteria bacterium]